MGDNFFYRWKSEDVWAIIEPIVPGKDKTRVRLEFDKLKQQEEKSPQLLKYVLDDSELPAIDGFSCWSLYIKPALKSLQKEEYRRINDPIHGTIELHPLLSKIMDTPEFHRLNDIKQLGGVHYVYPDARHTRFEHSIGVCYLAGEFARMLKAKQPELKITDKEILCVEIAGLIHDLGHGPFSHMFEYGVYRQLKVEHRSAFIEEQPPGPPAPKKPKNQSQVEGTPKSLKWEHEKLSQKIFKEKIYTRLLEEFNKYGITEDDIDIIIDLIHYKCYEEKIKDKKKTFLYQIVANKYCGIDVDKWDYFARDGHFIGVVHDFDFRRLMSMSRVIWVESKKQWMICFRDKEMNNIYGMFRTRCSLFQRALHHKTKISAELMLCRAIALAAKAVKLTYDHQTPTESTCTVLEAVSDALKYISDNAQSIGSLDGFLQLTDSIIYAIKIADPQDLQFRTDITDKPEVLKDLNAAKDLLIRLAERRLYHEVQLEANLLEKLPNAANTDREELDDTADQLQDAMDEKLRQLQDKEHRSVFVQIVYYEYGSEKPEPDPGSAAMGTSTSSQQKPKQGSKGAATAGKGATTKLSVKPGASSASSPVNPNKGKDDLPRNDPVRRVYFYDKQTPMNAVSGNDAAKQMQGKTVALVRPQEFAVSQWKVHSDLDKKYDERIRKVVQEFKKK